MQAEILKAIQTISNPFLDYFFIAVTMLGSSGFYFIFIPLFYWCVDKRFGLKLGLILISSIYVNTVLKEITKIARPIGYPGIRSIFTQSAGGYSFPSGHAQGSTTVWGTLMVHYQKKMAVVCRNRHRITRIIFANVFRCPLADRYYWRNIDSCFNNNFK
nr:phosphatase PAP2 family protein [Thermoanaerobacter sp. X514]